MPVLSLNSDEKKNTRPVEAASACYDKLEVNFQTKFVKGDKQGNLKIWNSESLQRSIEVLNRDFVRLQQCTEIIWSSFVKLVSEKLQHRDWALQQSAECSLEHCLNRDTWWILEIVNFTDINTFSFQKISIQVISMNSKKLLNIILWQQNKAGMLLS